MRTPVAGLLWRGWPSLYLMCFAWELAGPVLTRLPAMSITSIDFVIMPGTRRPLLENAGGGSLIVVLCWWHDRISNAFDPTATTPRLGQHAFQLLVDTSPARWQARHAFGVTVYPERR